MTELPPGWEWTTIGEVTEVLDSLRIPVNAAARAQRPGDVPYYGATGQVGWIDEPIFDEELVLLGEDGAPFLDPSKPKAYLIDGPSWVNNHAHVLRAVPGVTTNRFFKHALDAVDFRPHVNGTTRLKLTQKAMNSMPIPLAPRGEQERIVAAIEEHLSRLDAAVEHVDSARRRTGVLAQRLVDSIWDRAETIALADLLEQPLANGRSVRTDPDGFPVLRLTALRNRRIDLSERKGGAWTIEEARPFLVREGDFFVSRGNGSLSLVGRGGLVDVAPDPVAYPDTLIRVRVQPSNYDVRFLSLVWDSIPVRRQIEGQARTTAGIYKVNQEMLRSIELPLPSLDEQSAIVERVSAAMSGCERVAAEVRTSQARSVALRRSILAAAFSGQLVPQDPDDEPASVLLERIRAERAASTATRRPAKARTR